MTLQKKIDGQHLTGEGRPRHLDANAPGDFLFPVAGRTRSGPRSNGLVWPLPAIKA